MNIATGQPEPHAPEAAPYHWTVDTFYRALSAGVFDHPERIELIWGGLIEKMGQNPAHASLISRLTRRLRSALEPKFTVREEKPLHIADDAEPVPDIMVVIGSEEDYEERHPTPAQIVLLVEVADTSAGFDTSDKALLYAQAGIADYWVVLATTQEVLVCRQPENEGYRSVQRLRGDETITPINAPGVSFSVNHMLSR